VQNYRVGDKPLPFGVFLGQRAPGGTWESEITHGCRGVVRVSYGGHLFDYDVPGRTFHPANELARQAMGDFVGR
jgi:hypothetical protein